MNLKRFFRNEQNSARSNRRRSAGLHLDSPVSNIQRLENKALLAGNVTAQLVGQTAVVNGDSAANSVEVLVDGGNVIVRGIDNTTINGSSADFILATGTAVPLDFQASLGLGDDSLTIDGVSIGRNASILAGAGNDTISVQGTTVTGTLNVNGGNGDDLLLMSGSVASNHINFAGGSGNDDIVIDDSLVGVNAYISGGIGEDDIVFRDATVFVNVHVNGNAGADIIMFDSTLVGNKSRIQGGAGADNLSFVGATRFFDRTKAFGGGGADNIQAESTVVFDGLKRRSFSGGVVDATAISTRITDSTTGVLAAVDALLGDDSTSTNGAVTLTVDNSTVAENAGDAAATLTISRTNSTGDLVVGLSSSDTTRLAPASSTVTIPDGQTSVTVALNAQNTAANTADAVVTITAAVVGEADSTIQITVTDELSETLTLTSDVSEILEDTGSPTTLGVANNIVLTATRTGSTTAALTVNLSASVSGQFNLPAVLTIPAGATFANLSVPTIVDNNVDQDTAVTISAAATGFTTASTVVTVLDNDIDQLSVAFSAPTISESGSDSSAAVIVSRNGSTAEALQVNLTSQNPESLTFGGADAFIATIPAGSSSVNVTINGVDEAIVDGDVQISVSATATGFTAGSDTIFATDNDSPTLTVSLDSGSEFPEDGGSGSIPITIGRNTSNNASEVVVTIATAGDARISAPTTAIIPAGQASVVVNLDAVDNNIVDQPGTGTTNISVSATNFAGGSAIVSVTDDDVATISLSPSSFSVSETAGVGGATLTLTRTDPSAAETVTLSYSSTTLISGPASVTFGIGETSTNVLLDVIDNDLFAANSSVLVTASTAGHPDVTSSIGIINDEVLAITMDTSTNTVVESVGAVITKESSFLVTGQTAPGATVQIDTNGDAAFDEASTVADGSGNYSFTVTLTNTDQNNGLNPIQVRSVIGAESVSTQSPVLDVHFAIGTVVRFTINQDLDNSGANDFYDVELLDTDAPITVQNFLSYVGDNSYDGLIVHRSPPDFVVQAGGFTVDNTTISSVTTRPAITNEFNDANSNIRGTLSMAQLGGQPDSGTSQWFVSVVDNSFLDAAQHTVFGRLIGDGILVADAINDLSVFDLTESTGQGALAQTPLSTSPLTALSGTVAFTAGTTTLVGSGSLFTTELAVGDFVQIGTGLGEVVAIASDTELTLDVSAVQTQTGITIRRFETPNQDNYVVFSNIGEILDSI